MKLNDNLYNWLKWICILCMPSLATFIVAMGEIWNMPCAQQIAATTTALATFLGAILGISSANYYSEDDEEEEE